MPKLDTGYVAGLADQAREGDSNAFAELYAATYPNQYAFASSYLGDRFAAMDVLQQTYVYALKNLSKLRDSSVVIAWLNQINFRFCEEILSRGGERRSREIALGDRTFSVRQVMTLPFTESQALLLRGVCGLRVRRIAKMLDMSAGDVRRTLKRGRQRLLDMPSSGGAQ